VTVLIPWRLSIPGLRIIMLMQEPIAVVGLAVAVAHPRRKIENEEEGISEYPSFAYIWYDNFGTTCTLKNPEWRIGRPTITHQCAYLEARVACVRSSAVREYSDTSASKGLHLRVTNF
jgi:hypothetical protein